MQNEFHRGVRSPALRITPQERDALQWLADGRTTDEIAASLGVSGLEAEALLAELFAAIGASTRTEAIGAAQKRGLLTSPRPLVSLVAS